MVLAVRQQLSRFSHILQKELFPSLESELGEIGETGRRLVAALELIPLNRFIPSFARLERETATGSQRHSERIRGQGHIQSAPHQGSAGAAVQ